MNLYLCHTRAVKIYVLANDFQEAKMKVEDILNKSLYGYSNEREVYCVELIAKQMKELQGKPYFSEGNNIII
jgi:hypothetical protein